MDALKLHYIIIAKATHGNKNREIQSEEACSFY